MHPRIVLRSLRLTRPAVTVNPVQIAQLPRIYTPLTKLTTTRQNSMDIPSLHLGHPKILQLMKLLLTILPLTLHLILKLHKSNSSKLPPKMLNLQLPLNLKHPQIQMPPLNYKNSKKLSQHYKLPSMNVMLK
jgi:hypothetical protein